MNSLCTRTWVEINLDNIIHNYNLIKAKVGADTKVLGVVKADAYGHGAAKVAAVLEDHGCSYFAVAMAEEAVELRSSGIKAPILILGYTDPSYTEKLIEFNITQAVGSIELAKALSAGAEALNKKLKVHLKVDTGMGRMGFPVLGGDGALKEMLEVMELPGLDIEGIFTHFAVSEEESGKEYTEFQYNKFRETVEYLEDNTGHKFELVHCANSGAVINYEYSHRDMVRPGIATYGISPSGKAEMFPALRPAMEMKTRIVNVRDFDEGLSVSYGRTYRTEKPRRIAVIPVGYDDGLFRRLSNRLEVLLHGRRVPQVGQICMDMCMIDVTDVPEARVGDVVTVFGRDGEEFISVSELADRAETIPYELLCAVDKRVPRLYIKNGAIL